MPSFESASVKRQAAESGRAGFVAKPFCDDPAAVGKSFVPNDAEGLRLEPLGEPELSLEEAVEKARAEGLEAGRAELPWKEAGALRETIGALEEATRGIAELRRRYLGEQRGFSVELALAIAEKLVRRHIEANPDALASIVEGCLAALAVDGSPEPGEVGVLRLAPAQLERLEQGLAPELERISREGGLTLEADSTLEAADVRVLSARRHVDARLEELLRRVGEALEELLDVEEGEA